jgi:hypothetical protein
MGSYQINTYQIKQMFGVTLGCYLTFLMPRGFEPVGAHDQPLAFVAEEEEEEEEEEGGGDDAEVRALLNCDNVDESQGILLAPSIPAEARHRAFLIRALALLCACSLSIGSH